MALESIGRMMIALRSLSVRWVAAPRSTSAALLFGLYRGLDNNAPRIAPMVKRVPAATPVPIPSQLIAHRLANRAGQTLEFFDLFFEKLAFVHIGVEAIQRH